MTRTNLARAARVRGYNEVVGIIRPALPHAEKLVRLMRAAKARHPNNEFAQPLMETARSIRETIDALKPIILREQAQELRAEHAGEARAAHEYLATAVHDRLTNKITALQTLLQVDAARILLTENEHQELDSSIAGLLEPLGRVRCNFARLAGVRHEFLLNAAHHYARHGYIHQTHRL